MRALSSPRRYSFKLLHPRFISYQCFKIRQARAREKEIRLETKKRLKFKKTARIRLKQSHFLWNNAKELNEKNIDRLKVIFQQHGCRRLKVQHRMLVIIDERRLNATIATIGISPRTLASPSTTVEYPELVFLNDYHPECLHE